MTGLARSEAGDGRRPIERGPAGTRPPIARSALTHKLLRDVIERLTVALFVFRRQRLIYLNPAAERLIERLRAKHRIELEVMLRDHLNAVVDAQVLSGQAAAHQVQPIVTLLTATNGEPLYVHVIPLGVGWNPVVVSVRGVGSEIDAVRHRYQLSRREAQVAELVLNGYRNTDIATTLGISLATTKKHLTRIFDKVGVNTRSQLQTRLA